MVGNTRVGSVREFVSQIHIETASQNADQYSVRVVYFGGRFTSRATIRDNMQAVIQKSPIPR